MDLSKPFTNWESELLTIKGIENRINYLEETIIKDLKDSYDGYLDKKMELINENMHLEDSISDPGVMKLHTINGRRIKDYDKWAIELENQIEKARNYLYSFYSWTENRHLLNENKTEIIENLTFKRDLDKGKSLLTQPQISLLAYYLRKLSIISPNIENKELGKAFSIITHIKEGQLSKTIKKDISESYRITNNEIDYSTLISLLSKMTETIKKDKEKYLKEGELK